MNLKDKYPEIAKFLDETDDYENTSQEFFISDQRYLLVTQKSEIDGGQILFKYDIDGWQPVDDDTNIDVLQNSKSRLSKTTNLGFGECRPSSDEDHQKVYEFVKEQVDKFSTRDGPDQGALACVWAVRHLVYKALERWVTKVDGTAAFDQELQRCYGTTSQEADVPAGGIIISPTTFLPSGRRNIGHVGLLGPKGSGEGRLIYSNSSGYAVWKQNFTLGTWIARYRTKKGLKIRFYRLPIR